MMGIMTAYAQKLINPRLQKIIYTIRTCNIVRSWLFLTTLLLWDQARAKIHFEDKVYRIRIYYALVLTR